jgi:hypothetical protein
MLNLKGSFPVLNLSGLSAGGKQHGSHLKAKGVLVADHLSYGNGSCSGSFLLSPDRALIETY